MGKNSKIFIAGHNGLVGSALYRCLERHGFTNLITAPHRELDLRDQDQVRRFFERHRPDYVFMAAAKVGGIQANKTLPTEFLYDNLSMATQTIHAAVEFGTKKFVYLGSNCIYPKHAPQPMKEESLLTGSLEPTNEAYAIAKIAGVKLIEFFNKQYGKDFISVMPTSVYGPKDNFDPMGGHVVAGLLRKFHEAKERGEQEVVLWGTGQPLRELIYADDLAEALLVVLEKYKGPQWINIGSGEEVSIRDLAALTMQVVGYRGNIRFDTEKPDGMMRKFLDSSKMQNLGWKPRVSLSEGLRLTYQWALAAGVFGERKQCEEQRELPLSQKVKSGKQDSSTIHS